MDLKHKKKLLVLLKVILTGIALYFVFVKIPFTKVWDTIQASNVVFVLLALLFFVISKIFAAFRLNKLFKAIHVFISSSANLKLYLLGMFYNLFLPGGIGGDGYKLVVLKNQSKVGSKKILMALLIDRLSGLLALAVLCAILYFFVPKIIVPYYLGAILGVIVLLGFYFFLKKKFSEGASYYFYIVRQSFFVQISQLISGAMLLASFNLSVELYTPYLFLFLISSVVSVIPFTVGGLGARELTFVYGSAFLGLEVDLALALSLLFYVITAFTSFFGIVFSVKSINYEKNDDCQRP